MLQQLQLSRPVMLGTAFTLSLVTVLIVRSWVESAREAAVPPPVTEAQPVQPPKMIMVAAQPLPAGHFLKIEDLAWQAWPDDSLSPAYIIRGGKGADELVGSVVRSGIAVGEPITEGRLVRKNDRGFLAAVLTPGLRAVTVPLTANAGLSGLVVPGDRVDVLLTATIPGADKEPERKVSETILQDIRVLAIDQKLDDQSNQAVMARTTTLEVTAKQAEILTLIGEMGKISMTLRSVAAPDGPPATVSAHPSMTWDSEATDLGTKPRQPAPAAATVPAGPKVGIVRGTTASEVEFPRGPK